MTNLPPAYETLIGIIKENTLFGSCAGILGWDEQTNLPPGGGEHRANQLSLMAGLIHDRTTAPEVGDLLDQLEQSGDLGAPDGNIAVNVREARRVHDRATKLPRDLVQQISRATALGQSAWIEARKEKQFEGFRSWLAQIIELKRTEAHCIGFGEGVPYDALLDEYEPGATTAEIQSVFTPLRNALVNLVSELRDSGTKPEADLLTRSYPVEAQKAISREVAAMIGFDFDCGRLDIATHPFCSGIGPGDCRLTTRYDEHHFPGAFFGTLHEAGHGIYEQGLAREHYGTAMGESCSLGIHESQSRLWENFVGRSRAFWELYYSRLQEVFPEALNGVDLDRFHLAVNTVEPSFIRVEADEVTYNLHIMLRFELEQELIAGTLQADDVPDVWNDRFESYFGIRPTDDSLGCLQDIHWSAGLIGYFPTYALGNMYAAQFANAATRELGPLDALYRNGEFQVLREWLNTNIHQRGKQYPAPELIRKVSGESLSHQPLVDHLQSKFRALYGI